VVIKARVRDDTLGGDNPFTWKDVNTSELFVGKRVVLFALPGGMLTPPFAELSIRK
jgi:peroxiredoxin